jgi:hypothetical protein
MLLLIFPRRARRPAADPFASFRGRERFRRNLANLGLFVSAADTRLLSLEVAPSPEGAQDALVVESRRAPLPPLTSAQLCIGC